MATTGTLCGLLKPGPFADVDMINNVVYIHAARYEVGAFLPCARLRDKGAEFPITGGCCSVGVYIEGAASGIFNLRQRRTR